MNRDTYNNIQLKTIGDENNLNINNENAENLSDCLYTLYQNLKKIINTEISNNGLTEPQLSVLKILVVEDGLSLKELSNRVGLAHSTVSGIVDRLEQRNLLERKINTEDKRHSCIYLSEIVKKHKDNFTPRLFVPITEKLILLNADEKSKVWETVSILNRILEEIQDE